jgi:large repetitive protein
MFDAVIVRGLRFLLTLILVTLVIYLIMVGCGGGGGGGGAAITPGVPGDPPETSIITDLEDEIVKQASLTLSVTGTSDTTSLGEMKFEFRSYKNGILVSDWTLVNGTEIVLENLSTGEWLVIVRAIDKDGQPDLSPSEILFVVDFDPGSITPETTIESDCPENTWFLPEITVDVSAASNFYPAEELSYEWRTMKNGALNDDWTADPGPEITISGITTGDWIINVRSVDSAGNVDPTPEECHFPANLEDTIPPPDTIIESGCPEGTYYNSTLELTISGTSDVNSPENLKYKYRTYKNGTLDQTWKEFAYPILLIENLSTGDWLVQVRANDSDGRFDATPAECHFQIDDVDIMPDTQILAGCPSGNWSKNFINFTVTGTSPITPTESLTYKIRAYLNGGLFFDWIPTPNTVISVHDLEYGYWEFDIRAVDSEGNEDPTPAECNFADNPDGPDPCLNDTEPPETTLEYGCYDYSSATTAITFGLTGLDNCSDSPDLSYQYRMRSSDSAEFTTWSAHYASEEVLIEGLYDGFWDFEFRAVDQLQNVDPTPAMCSGVEIAGDQCDYDPVPPYTTITSGKLSYPSGTTHITLGVQATDNCTMPNQISYESRKKLHSDANYDTWQSHYAYETIEIPGLYDGVWDIQVRAVDASYNVDMTPSDWGPVNISGATDPCESDTTPPDTQILSGCTTYPSGTTHVTIQVAGTDNCTDPSNLTYQYRVRGPIFPIWETWSSHYATDSLDIKDLFAGAWDVEVRATDESNNTDPSPAFSDTLEIDGVEPVGD